MKDYFDLWVLSRSSAFEGSLLARAVEATFQRRRTPLGRVPPAAIEGAFRLDPNRRRLWRSFLLRMGAPGQPQDVVWEDLKAFLLPILEESTALRGLSWSPGGAWNPP